MIIPNKINPLSYKLVNDNISSFKVKGTNTAVYFTPAEACLVDFGDGVIENVAASKSEISLNHTYNIDAEYIVKIIGNHTHFTGPLNTVEAITCSKTVKSFTFQGYESLTSIANTFKWPDINSDIMYTFASTGIIHLPDIFSNNISANGCSLMYIFAQCNNLITVDNNFKFPSDITLDGVFGGCTNLKNIPETILPEVFSINNEGLFINCYNLELDITRIFDNVLYIGGNNGLSQMFDGCVKITGTAPIDKIKELMNYDGNRYFWMFRNCTNITNYAELVDNGMA